MTTWSGSYPKPEVDEIVAILWFQWRANPYLLLKPMMALRLKTAVLGILATAFFWFGLSRAQDSSPLFFRLVVEESDSEWQPAYRGVDFRLDVVTAPRILRISTLRIDTRAKGIAFFATPGNGADPGEVSSRLTTTFLTEFGLEAALNATGFDGPFSIEGASTEILGFSVSGGQVISPVSGDAPVFLVTQTGEARIERAPFAPGVLDDAWHAVQGWYGAAGMLLDDGEIVTTYTDVNPRSVVGISRDGRYVYLSAFDGRRSGFSEGASLYEMGEFMRRLGCWDAMNLDGGGSTTLVLRHPTTGAATIVNTPSGASQRVVGNHIGVQALPLE